ncbi:WecB/TagA/CpsF family glycosyltransferase [Candidatus Peregrinibacteria bacterium]|nr:WecB/TagA/CpsF family glycosyltransferase [Candidatus Peregrinibacteria bacterium]
MQKKVIDIFGIPFSPLNRQKALLMVQDSIRSNNQHFIVTPNPEILLLAREDATYARVLKHADARLPDGIGVLWAAGVKSLSLGKFFSKVSFFSRILLIFSAFFYFFCIIFWPSRLKRVLPERISGTDFLQDICHLKNPRVHVFFLGAAPGIAHLAAQRLKYENPDLIVAGSSSGIPYDNEDDVIRRIRNSGATVLFVAYGSPKQEFWIYHNLRKMPNVKIAMGVGGAFDYISGKRRRAPLFLRRLGLEWVVRLFNEPRRLRRIFNATIKFPYIVLKECLRK